MNGGAQTQAGQPVTPALPTRQSISVPPLVRSSAQSTKILFSFHFLTYQV